MPTLETFITNTIKFVDNTLIPFILGIAFLIFVFNVIRYFVVGADNEDSRGKAKSLAIYSVLAFVLIISFWGIVNLLASSIGLEGCDAPTSDYTSQNFVGPSQPPC